MVFLPHDPFLEIFNAGPGEDEGTAEETALLDAWMAVLGRTEEGTADEVTDTALEVASWLELEEILLIIAEEPEPCVELEVADSIGLFMLELDEPGAELALVLEPEFAAELGLKEAAELESDVTEVLLVPELDKITELEVNATDVVLSLELAVVLRPEELGADIELDVSAVGVELKVFKVEIGLDTIVDTELDPGKTVELEAEADDPKLAELEPIAVESGNAAELGRVIEL